MENVERKKRFIVNTIYIALVMFLFYAFFKYALGLFLPFLFAMYLAYILQKPVNFVCKKTRLKKGWVSVFFVLLCFSAFVGIIATAVAWLVGEIADFFSMLLLKLDDIPAFIAEVEKMVCNVLSFLPRETQLSAANAVGEKLLSFLDSPSSIGGSFDLSAFVTPLKGVWDTAKQVPVTLVAFLVSIICCCFMTTDFETLRNIILSLFPKHTRVKIVRAKRLLFPSLGKMAKAYGLIILITFTELCLGMYLMKLFGIFDSTYIPIIAIIIAIIDIVPVLGTGTVVIPWAVSSLITGNTALAIALFAMYVCITIIRQIIEPKLVAGQLGLPPFATLMAMYIGSQLFGFIGLFLLPITLVMVKLLNDEGIIHVFHNDVYETEQPELKEDNND